MISTPASSICCTRGLHASYMGLRIVDGMHAPEMISLAALQNS